jgi:hypothetical protein
MTLIMQNKPNLPDAQMNVTSVTTKDYQNQPCRPRRDINPIKPSFKSKKNAGEVVKNRPKIRGE